MDEQVVTLCREALDSHFASVCVNPCYIRLAVAQVAHSPVKACRLAVNAGAHFVKTSTGFGSGGATVADVRLMRSTVGHALGVKASGGIRTLADALAMQKASANRIGTSAGMEILYQMPG